MKIPKPLVLLVLDGWGYSLKKEGNAIYSAKPQNFLSFWDKYPHTTLKVSGEAVGLPKGQMGNSEVGHLNLGAGRVVYQDYSKISKAIENGSFYKNEQFLKAIKNVKKNNSKLHLMGLLSDGGVHSHNTHIYAFLELCKNNGVDPCLHMFLDGRDVPPKSAITYFKQLEDVIEEKDIGKIATVSGRYYAMDRDKRWDRVEKAYSAIVYGKGETANSAGEAVSQSYEKDEVDEFVKPTVINSIDYKGVKDNDSIIFFNFRPDRARELTRALIEDNFNEFDRGENPPKVFFVTLTQYDAKFDVNVAFEQEKLKNILSDVLAQNNLKQLKIAETEKYAHVTFFFNGGEEEPRNSEDRILIPSPKVATYDLKPEMSAYEVADKLLEVINNYDVIICNFANPDMVGHTGVYEAAVKAIQVVDENVGKIVKTIKEKGGEVLITADHGNAEQMIQDDKDGPHTAHTTGETPLIYITDKKVDLRDGGGLSDVAPTMLEILGIKKPKEMNGESLLVH